MGQVGRREGSDLSWEGEGWSGLAVGGSWMGGGGRRKGLGWDGLGSGRIMDVSDRAAVGSWMGRVGRR